MNRVWAVLKPPGTARGTGTDQIIEMIHRMPGRPAVTGALVLAGAGVLLFAAVRARLSRPSRAPRAEPDEDAAEPAAGPSKPQCARGRHRVDARRSRQPDRYTTARMREILDGDCPAPRDLDPRTVEALQRIRLRLGGDWP
jgi:hypothetical protein